MSPRRTQPLRIAQLATALLATSVFSTMTLDAPHTLAVTPRAQGPLPALAVNDAMCTPQPASPPVSAKTMNGTQLLGPAQIGGVAVSGTSLVVTEPATNTVVTVNPDDGTTRAVSLNVSSSERSGLRVAAYGNLLVALRGWYTIVEFDLSGNELWEYTASEPLANVFTFGSGDALRLGAAFRDRPAAITFTASGQLVGELPIRGDSFARTSSGGMTSTEAGRYVHVYDSAGHEQMTVGDPHADNDPDGSGSPLHFYQLGGVSQLPDGRVLVSDTEHGIMVLSSSGFLLGTIPPSQISPTGLTESSSVTVLGSDVYLVTGARWSNQQYVTRYTLADLLARVTRGGTDQRLGLGAGLTTGVTGNYFPPGRAATVRAILDPWWQRVSAPLSLCWTLQSQEDLQAGRRGLGGVVDSANWSFGSPGFPLAIPGDLAPDAYVVKASLLDAGTPISSTELIVTVGAPGQTLDLDSLPPGADWGGPAPARGIALTDELGTKTFRDQLDWHRLLDNGTSAPLDFSYYDARFGAASAEAERRGDTFIVQIGQGGPERALVDNGTWAARVAEVVAHFKTVVHFWEVWNEPNITFGNATDYTERVLKPAYAAVKQVDPSASVIGGSTVGVDLAYWRGIVASGGLAAMDVAAVHPYTGHNRSWEEEGTVAQLRALRTVLTTDGRSVPIWITELAWWSDGAANLLRQADDSSRALLWMAALGIQRWAYFLPEAGWGNDGVTFSAVEVNDYVKPAALALMTTSHELAGRPFLGEIALGAPSAYALRFGPRAGDPTSGELLVAWTDDVNMACSLSADQASSVTATQELGASTTQTVDGPTSITLTGSPVFLAVNGAGHLALKPAETFGVDLAAASAGASVSASSAVDSNPAWRAIDGVADAEGGGELGGTPAWKSAPGDPRPTITVDLAAPSMVDRILVSSHSLGSTITGLRDFDVQVRAGSTAPWTTVRSVRGLFYQRQVLVTFTPQVVSSFRVVAVKVNLTGTYEDGSAPPWWQTDAADQADPRYQFYGPAVIWELMAFSPGMTTATREAAALTVVGPGTAQPLGGSVRFAVRLSDEAGGLAGRTVALLQGTSVVGWSTTSANGAATLIATVRQSTSYSVRFAGDSRYLPAASGLYPIHATRRTVATLSVERTLSARGSRTGLVAGRVYWSGTRLPLPAVVTELWGRAGAHWRRIAVARTDASGRARFAVSRNGIRFYALVFRGAQVSAISALPSLTRPLWIPISR